MTRKILAGILIAVSSILLGLSIAIIVLIWAFKQPLTQYSATRLGAVDTELGLAQAALKNAVIELERTLRTVEAAEVSLESLRADFTRAKALFGVINGVLDEQLLPGLKLSRDKIDQTRNSLLELQASLANINALPFINIALPGDKILGELISGAGSLDLQITQVEDLVGQAATFVQDASYLMEGDLTETKDNLQNFLTVVREYDLKLTGWRQQLVALSESLPVQIQVTAVSLTAFLLWFILSEISVIMHGLSLWRRQELIRTGEPQNRLPTAQTQEESNDTL